MRQFDLCDTEELRRTFAEAKPDVVVHTAALARIDYCQSHQDEAGQGCTPKTRNPTR